MNNIILLLGCKLKALNGFHAIIEEDSCSAIQWGSTSLNYPWRMANWVEEIWSISFTMGFSFSHVNRECNTLADILGEDGASRASLVFDV